MILSSADSRLGAVSDANVSVSRTAAIEAAEPTVDVHVVRTADCARASEAGPAPVSRWIDPCTGRVWGSPNSAQLYDLAIEALCDEQRARARRQGEPQ